MKNEYTQLIELLEYFRKQIDELETDIQLLDSIMNKLQE